MSRAKWSTCTLNATHRIKLRQQQRNRYDEGKEKPVQYEHCIPHSTRFAQFWLF